VPVAPGFYDGPQGDWLRGPAGTQIEVTKGDGTNAVLTLADYF
jgi:hypothetical protein